MKTKRTIRPGDSGPPLLLGPLSFPLWAFEDGLPLSFGVPSSSTLVPPAAGAECFLVGVVGEGTPPILPRIGDGFRTWLIKPGKGPVAVELG